MGKMQKSIIGKSLTAFSIFFIFISISYALDNCKSSVLSPDEVPCLMLLPVINNTNCDLLSTTVYQTNTTLYSMPMSNYSDSFCSAIFNQTSYGTYTARYSTGDTANFVVEGKMLNLIIGIFFLAAIMTFLWLMHRTRDVEGSSFIYSGMAMILCFIFSSMLFFGFKFFDNVRLGNLDINYVFASLMLLFGLYCMIVSYNLVLDYRSRVPKKEEDYRNY